MHHWTRPSRIVFVFIGVALLGALGAVRLRTALAPPASQRQPPVAAAAGIAAAPIAATHTPTVYPSPTSVPPTVTATATDTPIPTPTATATATATSLPTATATAACPPVAARALPPGMAAIPVLLYHTVEAPISGTVASAPMNVRETLFDEEMAYLEAHHYTALTVGEAVDLLRNGQPLPRNPVVINFDDGFRSGHSVALGILKRHHLKATFFVSPGYIGYPAYLTWDQVRDLHNAGMEIGSHTLTHPVLSKLGADAQWAEIAESKARLEKEIGAPVRVFSYPYGDFTAKIIAQVQQAGYIGAVLLNPTYVWDPKNLYMIPRFTMREDDTLCSFAAHLPPLEQ